MPMKMLKKNNVCPFINDNTKTPHYLILTGDEPKKANFGILNELRWKHL